MSNPTAVFIRSLDCESDRQSYSTANCPGVMVRSWAGTGRVTPLQGWSDVVWQTCPGQPTT